MESLNTLRIKTNGGTQPRGKLNDDVVKEYADALKDGAVFPPVTVFFDGSDYWLADGFHRHAAHLELDRFVIDADVKQGTLQDAQWYSLSANQTHGLRRTRADVERAVKTALRMKGAEKSNVQIATHVGCSDKTVAKYRDELETTSEIPRLSEREGADGKTRRLPERRPTPEPTPKPTPEPAPIPASDPLPTLPDPIWPEAATPTEPEPPVNPDTGEVETGRAEMLLSLFQALKEFKLDGPLIIGENDAIYEEAMSAQQMLTDWLGV